MAVSSHELPGTTPPARKIISNVNWTLSAQNISDAVVRNDSRWVRFVAQGLRVGFLSILPTSLGMTMLAWFRILAAEERSFVFGALSRFQQVPGLLAFRHTA